MAPGHPVAHRRGRASMLMVFAVLAGILAFAQIRGVGSSTAQRSRSPATSSPARATVAQPQALLVTAPRSRTAAWRVVATVGGAPAAWLSQQQGVTLMRFDQQLLQLDLHAGRHDGGSKGWTYGNSVAASEAPGLVAAFNGGFKLTYKDTGFMANGHVARALKPGLASIVTYTDGSTDIGAWGHGVPSAAGSVFSVLQNQHLLVDHGRAAPNSSSCILLCWGGTINLVTDVARSGLGITAQRQLVWAAGEHLSPEALAQALIRAGAQRAIELDINPWWVAGYLYLHHSRRPKPVPLVPHQRGIEGALLRPDTRDFLTIVAKRARNA